VEGPPHPKGEAAETLYDSRKLRTKSRQKTNGDSKKTKSQRVDEAKVPRQINLGYGGGN